MARGIYKRGKVYWIRYAGLDGKIVRESTGATKFKDAQDLLIERKQAIKEGRQPEIRRVAKHTFSELAGEYVQWVERQRSFRQKLNVIKNLVGVFGKYPLRSFTTKLIEQYQAERMQLGNNPATINRHVAQIKHMSTKAVEWEMVEEEVLKRVRRAKLLPENNRRLRYLSSEECRALVNKL